MIVPVTSENEIEWAELCVALWPEESIDFMLSERAENKYSNEFLYIIKSKAVGLLSLSRRFDYVEGTESSPVGYLEGIYVMPEYRHKGIAKELVEYAKKWSLDNGCIELASDCEIENDVSRKFHTSIGFEEANTIVCFTMKLKD